MENTTPVSQPVSQHKVDTHSYKGWLNSDRFLKRAFAIYGYATVASLIIVIPIYIIILVVVLAIGSGTTSSY